MTADMEKEVGQAPEDAWRTSRKVLGAEVFLALLSGAFYATAFPPLNWEFAAWMALAPLHFLVVRSTPRRAFGLGFLWGCAWALPSFFWFREIALPIPFVVAPVLALFPAVWAGLTPVLTRHVLVPTKVQLEGFEAESAYKPSGIRQTAAALVLAALWCALEWVRSWIFTGLPWNLAGASQWKIIPIIQIAEYTGVYGISFLIVYVNVALSMATASVLGTLGTGKYRRPVPLMLGMILVMASALIGFKSMLSWNGAGGKKEGVRRRLVVAAIQGNIPQCRFATEEEADKVLDQYLRLSELAVLNKPDVMVWPETAVPLSFRSPGGYGIKYRSRVAELAHRSGMRIILGTIDYDFDHLQEYKSGKDVPGWNTVFLIGPDGKIAGRYNKTHLVPFGEYVPLGRFFPWLVDWIGMGRGLSPGRRHTVFDLGKGARGGVCVCYEDVFPGITRAFVRNGANILLDITNDAWYPTSSEPEQHLANSVFRAVETRRPLVRVGNSCGSCLVLPNGAIVDSVVSKPEADGTMTPKPMAKCRGFAPFKVDFDPDPPLTFYSKYGDVFAWLCALVSAAALLLAVWKWRDKRRFLAAAFKPALGAALCLNLAAWAYSSDSLPLLLKRVLVDGDDSPVFLATGTDRLLDEQVPPGDIAVRFEGFNPHLKDGEIDVPILLYERMVFHRYPNAVFAASDDKAVNVGKDMLDGSFHPDAAWLAERGVSATVVIHKDPEGRIHVAVDRVPEALPAGGKGGGSK